MRRLAAIILAGGITLSVILASLYMSLSAGRAHLPMPLAVDMPAVPIIGSVAATAPAPPAAALPPPATQAGAPGAQSTVSYGGGFQQSSGSGPYTDYAATTVNDAAKPAPATAPAQNPSAAGSNSESSSGRGHGDDRSEDNRGGYHACDDSSS